MRGKVRYWVGGLIREDMAALWHLSKIYTFLNRGSET